MSIAPTTPTTTFDVRLPAGAVCAGDWEDGRRVIFGAERRGVTGHSVFVEASAVQLADGGIEQATTTITGATDNDWGLTSAQLRQLVAVQLEVADLMDSWTRQVT
jgi:hypothetical protein